MRPRHESVTHICTSDGGKHTVNFDVKDDGLNLKPFNQEAIQRLPLGANP